MASDQVKPKRVSATVFDMVRSLGLLAVVVAVTLVFVPGLFHPGKSQKFQAVSYTDYVTGFKQVTGLPALVPTGLAKPWYANSADLKYSGDHAHLHIGWVTPTSDYAAFEESNQPTKTFIAAIVGAKGLHVTGYEQIAGETWTRCVSTIGEDSLTRTADGITIVITGSASPAQQAELAAAVAT